VSEDDDRRRAGPAAEIVCEPGELLRAKRAEAVRLEVDDVDQADKVDAAEIIGVPAAAGRALAETVEIGARVAGSRMSCSPGA
jgi:hypothetical protein